MIPKISEEGNEVETLTARLGVCEGEVGSSDEGSSAKARRASNARVMKREKPIFVIEWKGRKQSEKKIVELNVTGNRKLFTLLA